MLFQFEAFSFSFNLRSTFVIRGHQKASHRKGLIIKLQDQGGHLGYGEAAPLLGMSLESTQTLFLEWKQKFHLKTFDFPLEEKEVFLEKFSKKELLFFLEKISLYIDTLTKLASLRWGIFSAFLDALALRRRKKIIVPKPTFSHALIGGNDPGAIEEEVWRLYEEGFTSFKIKVGRKSFKVEQRLLNKLFVSLGNEVFFHLDANQAWSLDQAIGFFSEVETGFIDFIEEPLQNPLELAIFYEKTKVRVGIDENLPALFSKALKPAKFMHSFVLKPMMIGSFSKIFFLKKLAEDYQIRLCLSACFETKVGLGALIVLIHLLGLEENHHGLDTFKWFKQANKDQEWIVKAGQLEKELLENFLILEKTRYQAL